MFTLTTGALGGLDYYEWKGKKSALCFPTTFRHNFKSLKTLDFLQKFRWVNINSAPRLPVPVNVFIAPDEIEAYKKGVLAQYAQLNILPYPQELRGNIGKIRNYILDYAAKAGLDRLIMLDDNMSFGEKIDATHHRNVDMDNWLAYAASDVSCPPLAQRTNDDREITDFALLGITHRPVCGRHNGIYAGQKYGRIFCYQSIGLDFVRKTGWRYRDWVEREDLMLPIDALRLGLPTYLSSHFMFGKEFRKDGGLLAVLRTDNSGGIYSDAETLGAEMVKELGEEFCRLRDKKKKDSEETYKEVKVFWKKLYESGAAA